GVDEGGGAAHLLHLRDHRERERRLARRLWAVDLDHAAARQPAHAERDVEAEGSGGDDLHVLRGLGVHLHDGTLAELLLDLSQSGLKRLGLGFFHDLPFVDHIDYLLYLVVVKRCALKRAPAAVIFAPFKVANAQSEKPVDLDFYTGFGEMQAPAPNQGLGRSEERRVGKEGRARGGASREK